MTAYEKRSRFLLLGCLHKTEIAEPVPLVGEQQFCFKCDQYRTVKVYLTNYRSKCKSCKASRNLGDDKQEALTWGAKHVKRSPRHVVEVRKDGELVAEITNVEQTLFSTHDEMRELAGQAQDVLRQGFPEAEELVTYEEGRFPF